MSFTGVDSLDASISKSNAWLADIDAAFGTKDRRLAYRVLRAWLHSVRDALSVDVAAHFAAQLPELLRGVFFDGWKPSKVPHKYDRAGFITRFAREAQVRDSDVTKSARIITEVARQHMQFYKEPVLRFHCEKDGAVHHEQGQGSNGDKDGKGIEEG